jgi:hypothetical protein
MKAAEVARCYDLDLVFVEADEQVLTLLWRCSLQGAPQYQPVDWKERTQVRLSWTGLNS